MFVAEANNTFRFLVYYYDRHVIERKRAADAFLYRVSQKNLERRSFTSRVKVARQLRELAGNNEDAP